MSFLDETLAAWQPYYEHELTRQDGEEIIANWSAFINVVSEWAQARHEGEGV